MVYRQYTPAQKLAYYRRKASMGQRSNRQFIRRRVNASAYIPRAHGRGDYGVARRLYSNYKKPYRFPGVGRSIGAALGSGYGPVGSIAGAAIGHAAQAGIKTVTGYGDYKVSGISANSLVYNKDAVPKFSGNDRCTVIAHSEFIKDIVGSTAFNNDSFIINPANAQTFPWLAQIAQNYEQYVIQGMIFQFKTSCGNAISSTNNAMGNVIMCTQYNSLDAPFVNKSQMENYEFAQSGVPCESWMHPIECDPSLTAGQGLFYVDNPNNNNDSKSDARLYNMGVFNIATQGMQQATVIGELWVTYKICFLKPRLAGTISGSDHYLLDGSTIAGGSPFGTISLLQLSTSSISYPVFTQDSAFTSVGTNPWGSGAASNVVFINPSYTGRILVVYEAHGGASTVTVDPTIGTSVGMTLMTSNSTAAGGFATYVKSYTSVVNPDILVAWVFQCNGGFDNAGLSPRFTVTGMTYTPSGATTGHFTIYSIPGNLNN